MSSLMPAPESIDRIEREFAREPIGKFMIAALAFHGLMIGAVFAYAFVHGFLPHYVGGGGEGDAIAVNLVSNAIPLPANEKPSDNVLATEHPSEAPAPPAPKAQATVDQTAIPIPNKIEAPKKPAEKRQEISKPTKPTVAPPVTKASPHNVPVPKPDNRVQVGEQANTQLQRATQTSTTTTVGTVTASSGGIKGFPYPWYLQNLERKMQQNVYMNEVDPRTPKGAEANITFVIHRDGTPAEAKLDRSSGSPTLDRACINGVRRIDTFGPLPSPPSEGNLYVSHHCDNH
jgi:protein TonB